MKTWHSVVAVLFSLNLLAFVAADGNDGLRFALALSGIVLGLAGLSMHVTGLPRDIRR